MSPPALRRYRAERLLRKEFPALRSKVLTVVRSQLRAKSVELDPADLEACYAQAWQGLYTKVLGGEQVDNPSAWLVLVTFRRAIDEVRSLDRAHAGRHTHPLPSDLEGVTESGYARPDSDFAGALDDRARLRQVFEGLRTRLSARECEAASLCYVQGLSRAEAAEQMGISEARMRKLMEGAGHGRPGVASKVGELLDTIGGGGWCAQQASLLRAYAFGLLDPAGERHKLAVVHCRECPACRAYVASLRGLASVLPPLPLRLVLGGAGANASATTIGAGWSGVAGSLTAKLAVTGLVALGVGYAVLGGRAHGSPVPHHAAARRAPRSGGAPARERRRAPHTSPHGRRFVRRSSTRHARSVEDAPSKGEPTGIEFGPERVRRESRPIPAPSTPTSGEFGFE